MRSAVQKYCSECAKIMSKKKSQQYRDREIMRRRMAKKGLDFDKYVGRDHECKVKETCIYGSKHSCMYMYIEGHSRLLAGFPIEDGRCGLYQKGKKKIGGKPKLPETGSWTIGQLQEV